MTQPAICPTQPRQTAQIQFSDGQVLEGPLGTTIEEFIRTGNFPPEPIPTACLIDGQLRELTYHAYKDLNIKVITLAESDGMRVYRRSLSFLLVAAAYELFPEANIIIDYGLNFGAIYCEIQGRPPFTEPELKQIESRMRAWVEADLPLHKERVPLAEARRIFAERGANDKLRLLKPRKKPYLTIYTVNGYRDYLHGYMVPSAGYLKRFAVDCYMDGFVLRYPRSNRPKELQKIVKYPKLVHIFNEYRGWMTKLGIQDVGRLNEVITGGNLAETILVSEALQELRVAQIATQIASMHDRVRLVLVAGPSSAGKTTFSKRLSIQLLAHGIQPLPIGLDNFIVERDKTPRDEEGDYDYESLYSLDLELFNEVLLRLMNGGVVVMPHYDFISGRRQWAETLSISSEHIIIIEGIHGLNPELVSRIPPEKIFRVYVSALTQLNLDGHSRIATTDTRLLRRIVRDARHRGYTARDTILRWPKVRRGEHHWIFPYQENADIMFNSALVYETAVVKPLAEPLLLQIEPGKPAHIEAKRLLSFLQWFEPCSPEVVPGNSILREFTGGSILREYQPG